MLELVRIVGALAWVAGIILFFAAPPLGLVVLAVAIMLTIVSVTRTRQRRHQELLDAARASRPST